MFLRRQVFGKFFFGLGHCTSHVFTWPCCKLFNKNLKQDNSSYYNKNNNIAFAFYNKSYCKMINPACQSTLDKDSLTGLKEETLSFFLDTAMSQSESNFEWMMQKSLKKKGVTLFFSTSVKYLSDFLYLFDSLSRWSCT